MTYPRGFRRRALSRLAVCAAWVVAGVAPAAAAELTGRVVDASGAPIVGASVEIAGTEIRLKSGATGLFRVASAPAGRLELRVAAAGFAEAVASVDAAVAARPIQVVLTPATLRGEITVVAQRIVSTAEQAQRVPGSYDALPAAELGAAHVFTSHEALRKLPGVHARDEEGLGLRPNLGLRGLNPTRSSKLLLLEDGLPLAYAPYGDNASYYHPPIERFESIELLKGSSQIAYGPQTVGGVLNYLTGSPPARPSLSLAASGGNRGYRATRAAAGTTTGRFGLLLHGGYKESDGARQNTASRLADASLKTVAALEARQTLTFKAAYYGEESQVTYSGLTQAEYLADPRQNPFRNDATDFRNVNGSLAHDFVLSAGLQLSTALYATDFDRDWWRQSSNSAQRPNDRSDPVCGGMANLLTTCGNEGRLRRYETWGLAPRLTWAHRLLGSDSELRAGVRWHDEVQERRQENGERPRSRSGVLVENNRREARAASAFVENRAAWGALSLTAGVRFESIDYERTNRLALGGAGVTGAASTRQWVPGAALSWQLAPTTTLFAGVHRGFSPPRAEDIVSNSGGVVELEPERSWNGELGVRSQIRPGVELNATLFRMDYSNQIVPASLAGGLGAALTNGGETLHEGLEGSLVLEAVPLFATEHDLTLRAVWTWLPTAEFGGVRRSSVPGFGQVSVAGNRLPYAPETLLTAILGYRHRRGFSAHLEAVYTGSQFADDLNSRAPSADGQRGLLESTLLWNASLGVELAAGKLSLYGTVKNLSDETAVVDRARGVLPTSPRLLQAGLKLKL